MQADLTQQLSVLQTTYNYYKQKCKQNDETNLILDDLDMVPTCIKEQNVTAAIEHLLAVYNVASEHKLIHGRVHYPGPGTEFKRLVSMHSS